MLPQPRYSDSQFTPNPSLAAPYAANTVAYSPTAIYRTPPSTAPATPISTPVVSGASEILEYRWGTMVINAVFLLAMLHFM